MKKYQPRQRTAYKDFPFDQVVAKARELIDLGHDVYQKYSCSGCGTRLGIDEPNKFYRTGACDQCDTITDIEKRGCNYMLHVRTSDE